MSSPGLRIKQNKVALGQSDRWTLPRQVLGLKVAERQMARQARWAWPCVTWESRAGVMWGHATVLIYILLTLPVLSPGTVSTVLGKSWDTGKEDDRTPIFFHSTFGGGVCYSGLFSPHFHTKSGHPAVGTSTTDIPALATGQKSYLFSNTFFS